MTDLIERETAIAAMAPMLRSMISRGDACDILRALPAVTVGVKPLVWEDMGENFAKAAAPLFGNIRCERYGEGGFTISWSVPGFAGQFTLGSFPTLEAAKAAAQADYEARILAALDAPPIDPAQIRADAMREAAAALESVADRWDCGHDVRHCNCGDHIEQWRFAADEVLFLIDQPAPDPVANAAQRNWSDEFWAFCHAAGGIEAYHTEEECRAEAEKYGREMAVYRVSAIAEGQP